MSDGMAIRALLDAEYNCPCTEHMHYVWDPAKAEANLVTHGISFAEAVTVLEDDCALTREDPDSAGEPRFVTLGMSSFGHVAVLNRLVAVTTKP